MQIRCLPFPLDADALLATIRAGRFEDAIRAATGICERARVFDGVDSMQHSVARVLLARVYHARGDYGEALSLLTASDDPIMRHFGDKSGEAAHFLDEFARTSLANRHLETSEIIVSRELAVHKALGGRSYPCYGFAVGNVARLQLLKCELDAAELTLVDSLRLLARHFDKQCPSFVAGLAVLAFIYSGQGRRRAARRALERSVRIQELAPWRDAHMYASTLRQLGVVSAFDGDREAARTQLTAAHKLYCRIFGDVSLQAHEVRELIEKRCGP